MSKQYGLILPNKNKFHKITPLSTQKPSIFNDDSDSSETTDHKPTGLSNKPKKQIKISQHKAIEEDPTVFQYDEIYDEMDQKRKASKLSRDDLDKKPKYINRLLAAAEKRKRENEQRIERQVQREREHEGDQFKDKEAFVTSAYKRKLEELKQLEEQEKREEYLESIGDVRKQGNLDGFYRHLYDQKLNYCEKDVAKIKEEVEFEVKNEAKEESDSCRDFDSDVNKVLPSNDDETKDSLIVNKSELPSNCVSTKGNKRKSTSDDEKPRKNQRRLYRSRKDSDGEDEEKSDSELKKNHLQSNLDADSDFSIDSSDSEDETVEKKAPKENKMHVEVKKEIDLNKNVDLSEGGKVEGIKKEGEEVGKEIKEEKELKEVKVKKAKVDIWKKRTVGEKFEEALKRYFERKALREAGN